MSIEKLSDASKIIIEANPYTQIVNEVIEHIKDNDAYRLYSFLLSKTRDWIVIKEFARKACGVGIGKAKKCWSYLERCGLIEYEVIKDKKGTIIRYDLLILNGLKFNKEVSFLVDKSSGTKTVPVDFSAKNPVVRKSTHWENVPLLKKDILLNKDKSFYKTENEKKHAWFDEKKSPFADVTNQSTSYKKPQREYRKSQMPDYVINKIPRLKRKKQKRSQIETPIICNMAPMTRFLSEVCV